MRALLALARYEEATRICQRALEVVKPIALLLPTAADRVRTGAYLALGYVANHQNRQNEARQFLEKGVRHARAAKLRDLEADTLTYLSAVLRTLGDFPRADQTAQQALAVAQASGNDYQTANILHFLSIINYYHADLEVALLHSQQAQTAKRNMGDSEGVVGCALIQALNTVGSRNI